MIHTSNPIIKHKAGLLNLAQELGNVSRACKVMGVSRDTFYRYQELVDNGGIDALIDKSRRSPDIKNRVDIETEQAVIAYAVEQPAQGLGGLNYVYLCYSLQYNWLTANSIILTIFI